MAIYSYIWYSGCLDLYLGVWICILDIWTCIWISELVYWGSAHHPVVYVPAARVFFLNMTPLFFLNTCIVDFVDVHGFEALLVFLSKSGQSAQMTMPARRASEFFENRRAVSPEVFFQSLISQTILDFSPIRLAYKGF